MRTWLLTLLSWSHLQLVEPIVRWWEEVVLGSWEEWLLALVRQGFEETTRFLNALGTWFLSLFSKRSYREHLRRTWQDNSWQQWWGEVAARPSTLNALVASLVAQQEQQNSNDAEGLSGSSKNAAAPQAAAVLPPNGLASQSSATGVAWWPRPIRDGVDSFGRLRQQGASLSARLERPVVFVQQSGMGILDELAKRRHGLIEDAKMASQLAVSRCFELARSTVRTVFFLPSRDSLAAGSGLGRRGAGAFDGSAAVISDPSERGGSAAGSSGKRPGATGAGNLGGASAARGVHKAHMPRSKSAHVNIVSPALHVYNRLVLASVSRLAVWSLPCSFQSRRRRVSTWDTPTLGRTQAEMAYQPGASAGSASSSMARRGLLRSRSYGRLRTSTGAFVYHASESPSDALSIIRAAGYPHELHTVTTDDGYVLRLERIPRPGARDVVFFMHGVLDTSMAWVSGGVTGSQAFAAWEAGMDVWLGNSRGNAPRQHQDPLRRGWQYWQYNINHMGMYDISAQLDHIHNIKCAELGAGTVTLDLDSLGPLAGRFFGGVGAGSVGKRMSASSTAATRMQLLPARGVSTVAAPGAPGDVEGASAHSGPVGSRSCVRMRQSNSDGNLYRWGSCNSASSGDRAALLEAGGGAAPGAPNGPSEVAASTLLAPPTPQQLSPQQQYSAATTTGGSASVASAASLGHGPFSNELLSPMASCDGSEDVVGGEAARDGVANGLGEAEASRRALGLEPSGAVGFDESDAACKAASKDGTGHGHRFPSAAVLAAEGGATSTVYWPLAAQSPGPESAVCRKVTLTVLASAAEEPVGAFAVPLTTNATAPLAATTFTLEAKTRRDFGPNASAAEPPALNGPSSRYTAASGSFAEKPQQLTHGSAGNGGADAGGAAGGSGGATASMMDVMNSVLGPAADAVTHAVASAGAAIATAAASATHMLLSSPQRCNAVASSLPALDGAAPSAAAASLVPTVSPFAVPASQASVATGFAVTDIEERGAERPVATGAGPASQGVWPTALGAQLEFMPQLQQQPAGAAEVCAVGPSRAAAAAEPASMGESGAWKQNGQRVHGTSFRRVCSTDQLVAAAGCAAGSGSSGGAAAERAAVAFAPAARLAAPEQSARGSSPAGSGSNGATRAGNGASWSGNANMGSSTAAAAARRDAGLAGGRRADFGGGGSSRAAGASVGVAASPCPYKLRCVAHSLGGMSVLIHLVNRLREGRPHNVSRLLLLTPAGFHKHYPRAATPVRWFLPFITRALRAVLGRSFCFPFYIPTPLGRALTFKLLLSASRIPGLGELLRLGFKALLDGDISQWDRALQMPHYSAEDMPAISVEQVLHLIQLVSSDAFRLYDYGSPAANTARYGSTTPPDVASEYWRLDLPVHLVGGRRDGIIPPANIHRHVEAMRAQGVAVSYREFDFGHLDFTFGVKEELRMYLMKVLRL